MTRRFGPYELEARLGSGATAEVWRATRRGPAGFRRTVVLKRLLPEVEGDRATLELLLGEARLAARLNHPNVVAVHEVVEDGGAWALVLDWVDGCDLRALLRRQARLGPPPPGLGAFVVGEVCRGLAHAHAARIIHRDVSPSNVMLSLDGSVKLVDFGVGKALAPGGDGTGSLKGNLAYMAPEQLARAAVDERADVYAAGVVLWETLAARRLFKGPADLAAMAAARTQPVAPPSAHNPAVPRALDEACLRAMAYEREARFASAAELGAALETLGHELGFGPTALAPLVQATRADAAAEAPREDAVARRTMTAAADANADANANANLAAWNATAEAPTKLGKRRPATTATATATRRWPWIAVAALALVAVAFAVAARAWWRQTPRELPAPAEVVVAPAPTPSPEPAIVAEPAIAPRPPPPPTAAARDKAHAATKRPPKAAPDLARGKLLDPFTR